MFPDQRSANHDLACFWGEESSGRGWSSDSSVLRVGKVTLLLSWARALPGGAGVLREEGPGVHQGEPNLPPLESRQQEVWAHFSKPRWRSGLRQRREESHRGPHWRYRGAWRPGEEGLQQGDGKMPGFKIRPWAWKSLSGTSKRSPALSIIRASPSSLQRAVSPNPLWREGI